MDDLDIRTEIALIISNGRDSKTSIRMAFEIVEMLEQKAKRDARRPNRKPKRGIGAVTQADLLRGR